MTTVFGALAHPTRRQIVARLTRDGPATATGLAAGLAISRQGVAKHLGLLHDAGLVRSDRVGRELRYTADLEALSAVTLWVDQVQGDWKLRMERLTSSLEDSAE